MTPQFGGPPDDDDPSKSDSKNPLSLDTPAATPAHIVRTASSAWQERAIKPLQAEPIEPANLGAFIGEVNGLKPTPIHVPPRLAQVAGWKVPEAFLQASAVVVAQAGTPGWDQAWIDRNAAEAGLSRQWEHLKGELDHPSKEGLERALEIGLD